MEVGAVCFSTGCQFLNFNMLPSIWGHGHREKADTVWMSRPSWRIWSSFLLCRIHSVISFCRLSFVNGPSQRCNVTTRMMWLMWREAVTQTTWGIHSEQIEDSLFIRYKPKYENDSHAVWASLQSCHVHLFCSSLYVGHVVDQRCSSSCDRWYFTA